MTINRKSVIVKCQNQEPITWEEYCAGASATNSHMFYRDDVQSSGALKLLEDFVNTGNQVDQLKKALFYGKDITGTNEMLNSQGAGSEHQVDWPDNIDPDVIHAVLGMATEAVELVENLLEAIYTQQSIDMVNFMEELGDLTWYMHLPFMLTDTSLDAVLRTNLLKLYARYGEKFDSDKAINRDLDKERAILETVN